MRLCSMKALVRRIDPAQRHDHADRDDDPRARAEQRRPRSKARSRPRRRSRHARRRHGASRRGVAQPPSAVDARRRLDDDRFDRHVVVAAAAAGLDSCDLRRRRHAFVDAAEHGIARAAAARSRNALSTRLTKNCEVALFGSLVRAIDSVPRRFLTPLSASLRIGARVDFCFMSAVMPPPWITKPGMTRWNTVSVEMAGIDVLEEVLRGHRRILLEQVDGERAERGIETDHGRRSMWSRARGGNSEHSARSLSRRRGAVCAVSRRSRGASPARLRQHGFGAAFRAGQVTERRDRGQPGIRHQLREPRRPGGRRARRRASRPAAGAPARRRSPRRSASRPSAPANSAACGSKRRTPRSTRGSSSAM